MNKTARNYILMTILFLSITIPSAAGEISIAAVPVDSGACCVNAICTGDMPEPECQALGGTWYTDQECDAGFECPSCGYYVVGDWNGNGEFNIADVVAVFKYFSRCPDCPPPALICDCLRDGTFMYPAMDLNGSCGLNIADIVWGWGKLKSLPNVLEPCPQCPPGPEPTPRVGNNAENAPPIHFKAVLTKQKAMD